MVSTLPLASQDRSTRTNGTTSIEAATEVASIGVLNPIVIGSVRDLFVANVVVKAAWVNGRTGVGAVAAVVAGRPAPMTPTPRTNASPTARPDFVTIDRRTTTPM